MYSGSDSRNAPGTICWMLGIRFRRSKDLQRCVACAQLPGYTLTRSRNPDPLPALVEIMSSTSKRLRHRLARGFCLLLVSGVIAPSTAQASCGHSVTSIRTRATQESLYGLVLIGSGPRSGDTSPADSQRNSPCTCPFCSSEERGSPGLPAVSYLPASDAWCSGLVAPRWTDQDGAYRSSNLVVVHARHGTFPIDRPPRFLQS